MNIAKECFETGDKWLLNNALRDYFNQKWENKIFKFKAATWERLEKPYTQIYLDKLPEGHILSGIKWLYPDIDNNTRFYESIWKNKEYVIIMERDSIKK